jgi:hypothetical protein
VRLGDIRAVDGIARASRDVDCAVGQLALAHARALVGRDEATLGDVSQRWAMMGIQRAAADAAAQAKYQ